MYLRAIIGFCICVSVAQGWIWPFGSDDEKQAREDEEQSKEEEKTICWSKAQTDDKLGVEFFLYTQQSDTPEDITAGGQAILNSKFDAKKETKFITHGYTDNGHSEWIMKIVQAILYRYDVNVICVNWEEGADSWLYPKSAANTHSVGNIIGDFIKELNETTGAPYSSHHLIGHSLGAHISGFAGARVGGKVGRITGLDPAGPCFRWADKSSRLSPDDALFVDAIHTDGDYLFQAGCGAQTRMAHADFYPNGGRKQPGCDWWIGQHFMSLFTKWIQGVTKSISCSHSRATELFYLSVNNSNQFTAYPCNHQRNYKDCDGNCGEGGSRMGYYADPSRHGVFTLVTGENTPFSLNRGLCN